MIMVIIIIIIITAIIDFYNNAHCGQISEEPFLSVFKLGLINSYVKIRYIDSSVSKWTIPRGMIKLSIKYSIN